MAAVAAEPGAVAPTTTTSTAPEPEPDPVGPGQPGAPLESDGTRECGPAAELAVPRGEDSGDGEQRRHVRPQLQPAAGTAPSDPAGTDELINNFPGDRFSPGVPGDPEYRSNLADPQPSAVFLHSLPAASPVPEAGLSLAEPAEPTDRDRGYTALVEPELRPGPAEDAMPDGPDPAGSEDSPPGDGASRQDTATPEPGPACVRGLSLGSEVRVCLDHVIDDALVVSFRLGEKVFSGVLMDVTRRYDVTELERTAV